jgi:hypothetical protein
MTPAIGKSPLDKIRKKRRAKEQMDMAKKMAIDKRSEMSRSKTLSRLEKKVSETKISIN